MILLKGWWLIAGCLLLVVLGCGGCTSGRESARNPLHDFDKTEVDLEHGHSEAASLYHRPHGVQIYRYDETDVDLSKSRAPQAGQAAPAEPAPSVSPPPPAPLPGN